MPLSKSSIIPKSKSERDSYSIIEYVTDDEAINHTQDLSISNWPEEYYGNNFVQLTQVKAKYDPENVFHFPQSIPPVVY
jgi:hypothetical protein